MALSQPEKRRFSRINLRAPIRYQILGSSEFDNTLSDNISVGGLSFIGEKFIAPATSLMLEINVLSRILRPAGKISWVSPLPHSERNRLGVEFTELNPKEKNYLEDYINMVTA